MRQGLTIGGFTGDLVSGVSNGVRLYSVDPATRLLSQVNDGIPPRGLGEGLCMYQSPTTAKVYGISITIQGILTQYEILDSDANGLLETNIVRSFDIGSEAEGCVADDDTGALYVSEEDVALWRYSAEPSDGSTREEVDVLDASSTVRVSVALLSKVAVAVAAYRGTSTTRAPIVQGVAEPGTSVSHTTPSVPNDVAGAWRISYWSDKNSATTRWEPPSGETTRASTYGTGSGRVSSLLTDSNAALVSGDSATTGGLTATADASASNATSWTVLLLPAG